MNTLKNRGSTTTSLSALAAVAAVLLAGSATAGLTYGNGVSKPITVREMRAQVNVYGEGSAGGAWSWTGTADMEFKSESELYHGANYPFPRARAYTFQQSRLYADRMNFLLNASAWIWPSPIYGGAAAHARIDTWVYTSEAMPYWLVLAGSRALISMTREDGTDAGVLSKDADGKWLDASGTLNAGWYHIQMSVEHAAGGIDATGPISGQFGIPAPGPLTLLALGGMLATRRAR